jgi:hypothetical protein
VPRNVVTLAPRMVRLARPGTRAAIEAALAERFRYRREDDRIEIDFPKSDADAKQKVVAALDEIEPRWRRVFVLYPRESSICARTAASISSEVASLSWCNSTA